MSSSPSSSPPGGLSSLSDNYAIGTLPEGLQGKMFVNHSHFIAAFSTIQPSVSGPDKRRYEIMKSKLRTRRGAMSDGIDE